jgi:eight-cysteine-cluster-containing protein
MRLALLALLLACSQPANRNHGTSDPVQSAAREAAVAKDSPHYAVFEGPTFKNACAGDGDCKIGGCSGEVCTAEEGVNTTCQVYEDQPRDATCGCVSGECIWYRAAGAPTAALPGQGEKCPEGKCAEGLTCVSFYGIAGARGPKFTSCEIPCADPSVRCPAGQQCITIADGPGRVCRKKP